MKQALDTKTAAIIVGLLVASVVTAGVLYFRDSFAPKPTVEAKPWSPPGAWSGAPDAGGPGAGGPGSGGMGAGRPDAPKTGGE